jgi:hypothetical protein
MKNQTFIQQLREATDLEISELLGIIKNQYEKIPLDLRSDFNNLKQEFKDQPNNFALSRWKAKMITLVNDFDFEIEINKPNHPVQSPNIENWKKSVLYNAIVIIAFITLIILFWYINRSEPIKFTNKEPNMILIKGAGKMSSFYMAETETTQELWRQIMGNSPSKHKDCPKCPVESVSWNQVQNFIKKLNQKTSEKYRLPTKDEWLYVAGDFDINRKHSIAWCYEEKYANNPKSTQEVKKKEKNKFGIYDIFGNVYEFCLDPNGKNEKIRMGGSYDHHCNNPSLNLPFDNEDSTEYTTGFRLAKDYEIKP